MAHEAMITGNFTVEQVARRIETLHQALVTTTDSPLYLVCRPDDLTICIDAVALTALPIVVRTGEVRASTMFSLQYGEPT